MNEEEIKIQEAELYNPEVKVKSVRIVDLISKELRFCRCKDTEKNVMKIAGRYRVEKKLTIGQARKIIHTLIMTNRNILEK